MTATERELVAAGWVRRDGFECNAELSRGGCCIRVGRWVPPSGTGRPWCSQHAIAEMKAMRRTGRT